MATEAGSGAASVGVSIGARSNMDVSAVSAAKGGAELEASAGVSMAPVGSETTSSVLGGATAGVCVGIPVSAFGKLELCASRTLSGVAVESLRGRPLFRFGDRGGFLSSVEGEGVTLGSAKAVGFLGGRPLFLFKGVTRQLTLESVSDFLVWGAPLPRP